MGFSGGGSNVLKPHTHNGLVSQDGGALDLDNVTQTQLTSGDIVYSDGVLASMGSGSFSHDEWLRFCSLVNKQVNKITKDK